MNNLKNGQVESLVRGDENQLKAMHEFFLIGSPKSKVEKVEIFDCDADDEQFDFKDFEILRKK